MLKFEACECADQSTRCSFAHCPLHNASRCPCPAGKGEGAATACAGCVQGSGCAAVGRQRSAGRSWALCLSTSCAQSSTICCYLLVLHGRCGTESIWRQLGSHLSAFLFVPWLAFRNQMAMHEDLKLCLIESLSKYTSKTKEKLHYHTKKK